MASPAPGKTGRIHSWRQHPASDLRQLDAQVMVHLRSSIVPTATSVTRSYSIWFNLAFWHGRPSITFGNSHGAGSIAECAAVLG
jgi:hypothetical protein